MLVGSNHGIKLVLELVQKAATESSLFEEDRNEQTNTSLKVIEQSLRLLNNVYADNKEAETNAAFMLDSSNIGNLFTLLKNLNNKIQYFVERNSQSEHQQDFAIDIVRLTGILMSALFNVNYSTKKNTELMSTNKDSYTQLVRIFELENLCAKAHSEYRSLAELIHSDYWEYAIDNSAEILDELISVGT
ncbi:hypothetical protein AX774_g5367 [Zancudomyces culisetae]|uniref:Uncharacterized protein n=1 Tax=Zancudomyces culisetae TaxID=1213189 RepID=A0A1R1PJP6_ZANCU|nr:hypothetical protein AX774_g5367 [Zancudomyces culisetae]|eukprot:OMH81188.1 hypothetical protein AX774_g5367 [Zancudomyces culisetae]